MMQSGMDMAEVPRRKRIWAWIPNISEDLVDELSHAGIDVVAWSSIVMPRITTVEQPIEELARVASLWMMEHVRGEAARTGERRCHVAEPKLVIGHSCAPPPK